MKVLVTGSNSGFGLLSVLSFARLGHPVVATMRNLDKAGELRAAAAKEGLAIELRRLDVTDEASIAAAIPDPAEFDVVVERSPTVWT